MNRRMIVEILSHVMRVEALLLLIPICVSVIYGEFNVTVSFLITAALLGLFSLAGVFTKPKTRDIYAREGFVIVALSWVVLSLFGALPFYISGHIPSFIDALFETVSGFTTTGSSILTDVEIIPKGLIFWRSFTHWIGGMGVLVFMLSVVPLADSRAMYLMRAEVPGPTVGKLVPKIKDTARILYGIYIGITVLEVILLVCGGMPVFDAFVYTFGSVGTGGFSMHNAGIAHYNSLYIEIVIIVFMVLCGTNFNLFYFILIGKLRDALKSEELRWYIIIILCSIAAITVNTMNIYDGVLSSLRNASFQVTSIITTTGYVTADFETWPMLSKCVILALMFTGACAGSTGGGFKLSRIILLLKKAANGIKGIVSPKRVAIVKFEGKPVETATLSSASVYLIVYVAIFMISLLLVAVDNLDFASTVSSVLTCLSNVGPGFGICGATGNFSDFSVLSKLVLSIDMLLGRLEIYPMLMLCSPIIWKKRF